MKVFLISASLLVAFIALPAFSQSQQDRAQTAVDAMGDVSNIFDQGTMVETVVPFETSSPDEVNLKPTDFDTQEILLQQSNTVTSRAYSAQKDSFALRPEVDLGNDPLALADDAVEQADAVAGGLFAAAGGECSTSFTGGQFSGEQFCTQIVNSKIEACTQSRVITVDREDAWQCHVETDTYKKTCNRAVIYSCTGATGGACRQQNILFSPAAIWDSAGSVATVAIPAVSGTSCGVKSHVTTINITDKAQLSELIAREAQYNGIMQVKVDGVVVATSDALGGVNVSHGGSATLNIATRDCGKRCSREAVYAGSTWIEDCSSTRRTSNFSVDLKPKQDNRPLGPVRLVNNALEAVSGSSSVITVEVLRANITDSAGTLKFHTSGACCGRVSTSLGASC